MILAVSCDFMVGCGAATLMRKEQTITRIILLTTGIIALALLFAGCEKKAGDTAADQATPPATETTNKANGSGLVIEDIKVGTGATAKPGDTVTVHYTGWLTDGTKFDSSLDRDEPFTFKLGAGEVIAGWDQGVAGMKVGGKRKLTIPPELGYGDQGIGPIPPHATLVFDIELLNVK